MTKVVHDKLIVAAVNLGKEAVWIVWRASMQGGRMLAKSALGGRA